MLPQVPNAYSIYKNPALAKGLQPASSINSGNRTARRVNVKCKLALHRPRISVPANYLSGNPPIPVPNEAAVIEAIKKVDWKARFEATGAGLKWKDVASEFAIRFTGAKAYFGKFINLVTGEHLQNRFANFRGTVMSKKWAEYHESSVKVGAYLQLLDLEEELRRLDWHDQSPKAIAGNVMAGLSRSAYGAIPSYADHVVQAVRWGTDETGHIAGALGYKQTERDAKVFSIELQQSITVFKKGFDDVLSPANARDVITWNRTFVNPANWGVNWGVIKNGVAASVNDLSQKALNLYDTATDHLSDHFSK
jgi:hypothetical protein